MDILENKLKLLPDKPGVYIMLNADNVIIYVGKAKNLKNRVRQYFHSSVKSEKVSAMVKNVADFNYILTDSENEAFTLENNLIKKNKPKYNILLKDDKTYPYLKINLKTRYPYFEITRRIKKDGSRYFGPFMGGISVTETLDVINTVYTLRSCTQVLGGKPKKECLNYHIKTCNAPCMGYCSEKEYMVNVRRAIDFLEGNTDDCYEILKEKMEFFAKCEQFEIALSYREKLKMLEKLDSKKITSLNRFINADVISYATNDIFACVSILIIRGGKTLGGNSYSLEGVCLEESEYITSFIKQYYTKGKEIPEEIIVNSNFNTLELEEYLKLLAEKNIKIVYPKQGDKKSLTDLAYKNAKDYLEKFVGKIQHKEDMTKLACKRLQEVLSLPKYPRVMECFDISHTSGTEKVGSMVVFIDGEAAKSRYRKFKIKTIEGNDDFACLQEVLTRRINKLKENDSSFPPPDLIVIDGGKGQLSSVLEVFESLGCLIPVISLAEKEELIFTPYQKEPIALSYRDYALKVLQRLRDEAHRFAITYHRSLRDKRTLTCALYDIEGLGKKKVVDLLRHFGSVKAIMQADESELMKVEGIGEKTASLIVKFFAGKS